MKKTVKVLGLLFVAAAMFMGCKQNAEEPAPTPSIDGELFSEDDVTVAATNGVELSDGKWTFRAINKSDDGSSAGELIFNAKAGHLDQTSTDITFKFSSKGTISGNPTDAQIEAAKEQGYTIDGNTYSLYKEFDYQALAKYMQENPHDQITNVASFMYMAVSDPSQAPGSWKTNADKTKFFMTETEDGRTESFYLAKN